MDKNPRVLLQIPPKVNLSQLLLLKVLVQLHLRELILTLRLEIKSHLLLQALLPKTAKQAQKLPMLKAIKPAQSNQTLLSKVLSSKFKNSSVPPSAQAWQSG
jgi:hypothetical protein